MTERRLLIVEDDEPLRSIVAPPPGARLGRRRGHVGRGGDPGARDGPRPALVLLDINLPARPAGTCSAAAPWAAPVDPRSSS